MNRLRLLFSEAGLVLLAVLCFGAGAGADEKVVGKTNVDVEPAAKIFKLPGLKGGELEAVKDPNTLQEIQNMLARQLPPGVSRPLLGNYSINGNEFDSYHQLISWSSEGGSVNRYVSNCGIAVCGLEAPIHVLDGAHITGYSCKVLDNSMTHPVNIVLLWSKGDGFAYSSSNCMSGSAAGASPAIQTIKNTTCSINVDNSVWAYSIRFQTYGVGSATTVCESGGKACRIYNCVVSYQ
jgi:hypothetical protein